MNAFIVNVEGVSNSYSVTLDVPVYNIKKIRLVGASIAVKTLINSTNNQGGTIPNGNYKTPSDLVTAIGGGSSYDDSTDKITSSTVIPGVLEADGTYDLAFPRFIRLKVSLGSEVITQKLYTSTVSAYLGDILTDGPGTETRFDSTKDVVEYEFDGIINAQTIAIEFLGGAVGQHLLKFEIICSKDKLVLQADQAVVRVEEPKFIEKVQDNFIYILATVLLVLGLLLLFR